MKSKNKFLDGNWHPVEETSAENLKVSGEIPKELAGLFLRNGPNPKKFDARKYIKTDLIFSKKMKKI